MYNTVSPFSIQKRVYRILAIVNYNKRLFIYDNLSKKSVVRKIPSSHGQ